MLVGNRKVAAESNDHEDSNGLRFTTGGPNSEGMKRKRRKFLKAKISYYRSKASCSSFQLRRDPVVESQKICLAGDIESNPGPVANPCSICKRPVAKTHRAILCVDCNRKCHIGPKCGNITVAVHKKLVKEEAHTWKCPKCYDQSGPDDNNNNNDVSLDELTEEGHADDNFLQELKNCIANKNTH